MLDITVIILTFNEELHIRRCLERVSDVAREVYVVDSGSTDRTRDIAEEMGAKTVCYDWPGCQAVQFNRALDNLDISTEWVLRLDADEYLTPELIEELHATLPSAPADVNAFVMPRGRVFLGRRLKHGIDKDVSMIRLFRRGKARYGMQLMDEHLTVTGRAERLRHSFIDDNLLDMGRFVEKHNDYALREAATQLLRTAPDGGNLSAEVERKRKQKQRYNSMPLMWRALAYFFYRYIFKLGFLDGREGFLWDFMQGLWYRTLVDTRILEIRRRCGDDTEKIKACLINEYGFKID